MPKIVNTTIQYSTVFEKDHLKIRGGGGQNQKHSQSTLGFCIFSPRGTTDPG